MEVNVHNYKQITKLNSDDRIVFTPEYIYGVGYDHICNKEGGSNDAIFFYLCVEKISFCSEAYGYKAGSGCCPVCKDHDYPALLRLVNAIFNELIKQGKIKAPVSEIQTKKVSSVVSTPETVIVNIKTIKFKPKIIL